MGDIPNMSTVSIPLLCWGGSPRRLRQRSPAFSDDMAQCAADLEVFLFSDDPAFTALLNGGEHCWVDVPAPDGQHRLFAVSFLYQEPGVRPVWYFICMLIGREQWRMIGSHRRFFEALRAAAPSLWNDPVFRSQNSIELRLPEKTELSGTFRRSGQLLPVGPCSPEDALRTLEDRFPMDDDVCFQECTVAWNPAMYDPNWSCVVRTKERTIPARSTTPDSREKKAEKPRTTGRCSGRKGGRKIVLGFLIFVAVAAAGGLLVWQRGVEKPLAKEENVNQHTVRAGKVKEDPGTTRNQEEVLLSSDDVRSSDLGITASESLGSYRDVTESPIEVSHRSADMEPTLLRGSRSVFSVPLQSPDVESKDLSADMEMPGSDKRSFESPEVLARP